MVVVVVWNLDRSVVRVAEAVLAVAASCAREHDPVGRGFSRPACQTERLGEAARTAVFARGQSPPRAGEDV